MSPLKITLEAPEYTLDALPDFVQVGAKIDQSLAIVPAPAVIRALSRRHHALPFDELVSRILVAGTDRISNGVRGRGYHEVDCDFFGALHSSRDRPIGEIYVRRFWEKPIKHGGVPERTDIFLLYDPAKVENVPYLRGEREMKDGYRFIDPSHKADALIALVQVLP